MLLCELALEMGMPLSELGERMSLHELTVVWPAYFQARNDEVEMQRGSQ